MASARSRCSPVEQRPSRWRSASRRPPRVAPACSPSPAASTARRPRCDMCACLPPTRPRGWAPGGYAWLTTTRCVPAPGPRATPTARRRAPMCSPRSPRAPTSMMSVRSSLSRSRAPLATSFPPAASCRRYARLCDSRGWLLILDESITGFGRTGRLFACERFGVCPDIMVLSKGLGGGFPLTAVCASPERWAASALAQPSGTTTAFGGDPLACAAGLVTLQVVTSPGFLEQVRGGRGACCPAAGGPGRALRSRHAAAWRRAAAGLRPGRPEHGDLAPVAACEAVARACRERGVLTAAHVPRVRLNPPLRHHAGRDRRRLRRLR